MIAGLETPREETHAVAATHIVDVQRLARGAASDAARSALLADAVRDNRDVAVLRVAGSSLPDGVLSPWSSSATTRSPHSAVSERTVQVVRSTSNTGGAPVTLDGHDPTNPDHWHSQSPDSTWLEFDSRAGDPFRKEAPGEGARGEGGGGLEPRRYRCEFRV
jgi:hypothetical protein